MHTSDEDRGANGSPATVIERRAKPSLSPASVDPFPASSATEGPTLTTHAPRTRWLASTLLLLVVLGIGAALAAWKRRALQAADAAAAALPEPMEAITVAVAKERQYARTTTAIGTVLALRSITLRNELPGTVQTVMLEPGQIVETGTVLVALDVAVEEAELRAQEAQAVLAETLLARLERASENRGASAMEVDRARAERDVARAQVERMKAVIARKTIRAPFRAVVGLADVHPGQYLDAGTRLTTLQGVDEAAHIDFTVAQAVAAGLQHGQRVEVIAGRQAEPVVAEIVAVDARVDPATRNAAVRARIQTGTPPSPGASVRVRVPIGEPQSVVAVPVSAVRKGPEGDHVFVIRPDERGSPRAHLRLVRSGAMLGDEMVVHEGLQAGEQVAASGSFKLRENALVAIAPDSADAGSGPQAR